VAASSISRKAIGFAHFRSAIWAGPNLFEEAALLYAPARPPLPAVLARSVATASMWSRHSRSGARANTRPHPAVARGSSGTDRCHPPLRKNRDVPSTSNGCRVANGSGRNN
jgi:hypothetical protein